MYIIFYIKKISKASTAPNKNFENLDKPQKLPTHEHAMDGVYFNGSSIQGDRFSMAMNRRNGNEIETYIFVKIASLEGTLVNVDNPNASLNKGEDDSFSAEGFNIVSIIPTKKWKITYNGKMKNAENAQIHNVHLNLDFFSNLSIFDYGTDFDHLSHAKALALELWSGAYFDILKEFHLMCYGQFSKLKGKVSVDVKEYELKMDSYRDHTVADNFNWATYHRYITHYINVENGDRFVITKLSQPVVTSNFSQGFMYNASDKKYYPLQKCNLELYQHGETEKPPVDYAFLFAAGGREFTIQIKVEDSIPAYLGKNWDCKLLERFCSADVNGKKGWGSCQWLYRNVYGKSILSKTL
ncbi:hypothetical protein RN001_012769 [Aquatica leii]|uniref:Uncharacterized protein n=1 Tax=Aquatica leii TaxID=1421715 RepID=A0AAN7SDH3_9COLE|nr:hypothetical protein RN001_012769 [Aquatica leii]